MAGHQVACCHDARRRLHRLLTHPRTREKRDQDPVAIEVLIPTYDEHAVTFQPAPRVVSLAGSTVGIISNGKQGTVAFFDAMEVELRDRYRVADVVRLTKPNYSAPAPAGLMSQARHWHALIAGVGD